MRGIFLRTLQSPGGLVLLGIAIMVVIAGVGVGFTASAIVAPETPEAKSGWKGYLHLAGGIDKRGEVYVTAGEPGYKSQTIIAESAIELEGALGGGGNWKEYQYKVFINDLEQPALGSGPQAAPAEFTIRAADAKDQLKSHIFTIDGPITGTLRVEFWVNMPRGLDRLTFGATGTEWVRLGFDGAKLVSGAGSVKITPGQSDKFEEGETIKLDVRTGRGDWILQMYNGAGQASCGFRGGGFLPAMAFDMGQNANMNAEEWKALTSPDRVSSYTPPEAYRKATTPTAVPQQSGTCRAFLELKGDHAKTVNFVVPPGAFVEKGNNVWRVVLRNTLMDHATEQLVVLDKKIYAPEPPATNMSPQKPNVGDDVLLSMGARTNPQSGKAIDHFVVFIWYGTSDLTPNVNSPAWLARGISIPAESDGAHGWRADYKFTIKEQSVVKSRVYAVDVDGRPSGSSLSATDRAELQVIYKEAYPTDTQEVVSESRPTVVPQGAEEKGIVGPQPPPQKEDTDRTILLLVGLALAICAFAWAAMRAPIGIKIAVVAAVVGITVLTGYTWLGAEVS